MFLRLDHQKLDVFILSKRLVSAVYIVTLDFPSDEKFALIQQIRRAVVSVHLNIAEGCSRRTITERKRFFEIARSSLVEVDTALDIALDLKYIESNNLSKEGELIVRCFQMLTKMIH